MCITIEHPIDITAQHSEDWSNRQAILDGTWYRGQSASLALLLLFLDQSNKFPNLSQSWLHWPNTPPQSRRNAEGSRYFEDPWTPLCTQIFGNRFYWIAVASKEEFGREGSVRVSLKSLYILGPVAVRKAVRASKPRATTASTLRAQINPGRPVKKSLFAAAMERMTATATIFISMRRW